MTKRIIKIVIATIMTLTLTIALSGLGRVYATQTSTVDMDYLYNTLIVGDTSYANTLYYSGAIAAYMAVDADGIDIYVPDDPKGGTGTGVGIYRQDGLIAENYQYGIYTIYYGEFVGFNRHGHGSIYKTYKDASYTFTRSFYGYWEDDYPNGQGNESYTAEETGQYKKVSETSGVYAKDKFTGIENSTTSYYAGNTYRAEGISTYSYPYVNGYAEGTVTWTVQNAGKPQEIVTYAMAGGYLVNDRTSEYTASHTPRDFDPQTQVIGGWAEQNSFYYAESKISPNSYDYSNYMALK